MKRILLVLITLLVTGCATTYQSMGFTGGFDEKNLEDNIWRITFSGNGYATRETVQTYWVYHCSEVALKNGFEGFEILSHIQLTKNITPEEYFSSSSPYKKSGGYVYVPMYIEESYKPHIEADIRLLKSPFESNPPKVFDANELKTALEPIVMSKEKCDLGNVCPHVHKYLHPKGTFENTET